MTRAGVGVVLEEEGPPFRGQGVRRGCPLRPRKPAGIAGEAGARRVSGLTPTLDIMSPYHLLSGLDEGVGNVWYQDAGGNRKVKPKETRREPTQSS